MKTKRSHLVWGVVLTALLSWLGYRIYLARADLVTLNVRNMEVHAVARKIEWQTWEKILIHGNVSGAVTLNVTRAPLAEVLSIIALQTSSRWTALYPIYAAHPAVLTLEKVVRGEVNASGSTWSSLNKGPAWQGGGGTMFGNTARAANNLVSAQFEKKDADFAALALSRFAQARVVAEDNTPGTVNLKLDQVSFGDAVAAVASQLRRKWDRFYTLQPRQQMFVAATRASPGSNVVTTADTNATPPSPELTQAQPVKVTVAPSPPDPAEQARQMEAMLSTMTPQEREKAQAQIATMQQIQSLPEGERQARLQEMAAQSKQASQADFESRVRRRLRDGTTAQRIAHDREVLKRQQSPKP